MRAAILLALVFLVSSGRAQPGKPPSPGSGFAPVLEPAKEGRQLAERLTLAYPTETVEFNGALSLRRGGKVLERIPITSRLLAQGTNWQMIYETGETTNRRPERLVVTHTAGQPNSYVYRGPGGQEGTLAGAAAELPLAGSHFWLTDLGLEFLRWPDQRLVRHETTHSRACHVLESRPAGMGGTPWRYALVRSWIDIDSGGVVKAEAYGPEEKLLKEFAIKNLTEVNHQWRVERMEMRSGTTNTSSQIEFDLKSR